MEYAQRSDGDLVELAQAGWRGAFAVLLHRHVAAVHAAVADDADPVASTVEVFTDAMRALPKRDPAEPVLPWLLSLAGATATPDPLPAVPDERVDDIWRRLDQRWPDGRVHAFTHHQRVALLIAALVVASALIPLAVFTIANLPTDPEPADELQAFPVNVNPPPVVDDEPEPLPTFSFPVPPEEQPAPQDPATDPSPPPTTEPTPATTDEPSPEPSPTPSPGPHDDPGDNDGEGLPLPLPGGDGGGGDGGGGDGGGGDGGGGGGDGGGGDGGGGDGGGGDGGGGDGGSDGGSGGSSGGGSGGAGTGDTQPPREP